jgi:glycosyltransferase involved in cell wall biosynthesis
MAWHVLSSTKFDFDRFARQNDADQLPAHLLPRIAERMGAEIHQPDDDLGAGGLLDRLGALVYGRPGHWVQARRTLPMLRDGDLVYSSGDDAALPLALLARLARRRVSFAVAYADVTRRRTRVLTWLLLAARCRLMAVVTTVHQAEAAQARFGRRLSAIEPVLGQTDHRFFRPADGPKHHNRPPLVAACGVEQRDYATLARGLAEADVAVEVCFASPNRSSRTRYTAPDPLPENFRFDTHDFVQLRELYRRADVVVLPLLDNEYSAGLTALFEAVACGAPVVATRSPGIIDELIDDELIVGVPVGDPDGWFRAVKSVLGDPDGAANRATSARRLVLDRYSADAFLERLAGFLNAFAASVD